MLEEARDPSLPLLERVKFLAIFANNLDEFFMIRVSGLRRQVTGGVMEAPPDNLTPSQQLAAIRELLSDQLGPQAAVWNNDLLPELRRGGHQRQLPTTDCSRSSGAAAPLLRRARSSRY